jgi:hypothetical protein
MNEVFVINEAVTHQMAVPVPSISFRVLNSQNLFYQIQNALDFNWDMSWHLALCLRLLPFHFIDKNQGEICNMVP